MVRQKVVLMYPNFKWSKWMARTAWGLQPYNLCLIAAMIEDKCDVNIVDANFDQLTINDFAKKIEEIKPDVLGISVISDEYADSGLLAARTTKDINPNIKTVMGGVSATSNPQYLIKDPNVDYVVVGEGEYAFRDLCNFFSGEGDLPPKGVWYKKGNEIINTGRVDFILELDKLPLPAYHLVDFKKYSTMIQRESTERPRAMPYGRIMASRGCPFNCCFCEVGSISGRKPRLRSVENITKEIEMLIREYGIKAIVFDDDNLIINKERAKELFKAMIDKKYNLKWSMPATAVFGIDDEMIQLMKDSGCEYLNIAIESGSPRVLKEIIHKPLELETTQKTMKKLKEAGIDLCANFVIGFPGETWAEIRQTIKFAEEIDIDYVKFFIATPLPNTELFRMAQEQGCLREDYNANKHLWTDGWIDTKEFRHQDLKILRAYEWDRVNFKTPEKTKKIARMLDITEERLNEIRKDTLKFANP